MSDETLEITLPHGAWYDSETQTVSFSLDRCTFSFTLTDFFTFAQEVCDIATVLAQTILTQGEQCPTCGSVIGITEIDSEDYH